MSQDDIKKLLEDVSAIKAKLDLFLPALDDHEDRLRSLEKFAYKALGAVVIIQVVLTGIFTIAVRFIKV